MSNAGLRSQVNSLSREYDATRQYNRQLKAEITHINQEVTNANQQMTAIRNKISDTLESSDGTLNRSHVTILDAYELQGEIEKVYARYKAVELANKNIRAANNTKYYDFSTYRTVRKIVQGIMDNLDLQMVSGKTITKAVEVQHLQTPDYWLTCVLISIMAWRNDDKELADRAMGRAVALDKKNAAVFYMLFNLRMDRNQAARNWFKVYQDSDLFGSDQRTFLMLFSLISPTIADRIDDETMSDINTFVSTVLEKNIVSQNFSREEIIQRIQRYFVSLQSPAYGDYPALRKYVTSFSEMMSLLTAAKGNKEILEFILNTINVSKAERNLFLKDYIDELINKPNSAEQSVYDDIQYNELIIEFGGEIDRAKEIFDERKEHTQEELNLLGEMIDWLYGREHQSINAQIRSSLFTLTKEYQEEAVESYVATYQSRRTTQYLVEINGYETQVDFTSQKQEKAKIDQYYTQQQKEEIEKIKNTAIYLGFGVGALGILGMIVTGIPALLLLTVLGAGIGGINLLLNHREKKNIVQRYQQERNLTQGVLDNVFKEFSTFQEQVEEYHSYSHQIQQTLEKI